MIFRSILFEQEETPHPDEPPRAPDCFGDLNLDQFLRTLNQGREEYGLSAHFHRVLDDVEAIGYRQEIMRDLEQDPVLEPVGTFAGRMRNLRAMAAQTAKLNYGRQKQRWFAEAVGVYCEAVNDLLQGLAKAGVRSRGLLAFIQYLAGYVASEPFRRLAAETDQVKSGLAAVSYCLHIKGSTIKVTRYAAESDYSAEVEQTFLKFKQGQVKDYRVAFRDAVPMNHVEAQILDCVARLFPDAFRDLDDYCSRHVDFLDGVIGRFDREIHFYIAYLDYIGGLKRAGLPFCYPRILTGSKAVAVQGGFDLVLAHQLTGQGLPVVGNDFQLRGQERIFVVTGPNQGGKTTFARAFGQLHYLASLGCPVPASAAELCLCDGIYTHFEREEDLQNLRGKLQDDLLRIRAILSRATARSLIIMNEIFTSTTLKDALFLNRNIMRKLIDLDCLGLCVTFIDELALLGPQTVSMVSTVVPGQAAARTFKILRKPADGLAYAMSIVEKHGLTYARIKERVQP